MSDLVLLTGATGYIGGRLLPVLERRGVPLRCLARRPEYLEARVGPRTQVVAGDVLDRPSLEQALQGVHTAYYLVHSMTGTGSFEETDRRAAENFAEAAKTAGVRRIVYLGGLGHGESLSDHLASRQEVGRILREGAVPCVEFRASVIVGSGSLSFELIRALVEKLPVMVTPRWVRTRAQPIAVEDVIAYLDAALDRPVGPSTVYEIGGADPVSYGDLMQEYARQRGLRRLMIPVPFLTPRLSSLWLGLVTPVYARVGRKLIDGLRNPTTVRDGRALEDFPVRPRGVAEAIARALANEDHDFASTRWSDALSSGGRKGGWGGRRHGTRVVDSRRVHLPVPPAAAFAPIRRIGGANGWYAMDWAWRVRGFLDLLCGGVGLRRGRRDPEQLRPGDTLDFWRVEAVEPDRLLRLQAELKLPGRAWLQFEVDPSTDGCVLRQTAVFDPVGLFGRVYWYVLWPIHSLVFAGMLKGIARRAREPRPLRRGSGASARPGTDSGRPGRPPNRPDASGSGAAGA